MQVMDKKCQCDISNSLQQNLSICQTCNRARNDNLNKGFVPPDHILDNIWIGGVSSSIDKEELLKLGINKVMIIMEECCLELFEDFEYSTIPISTEGDIAPHLHSMADFINGGKSGVLIFDNGGSKRSGAGVAAYMIKYKDYLVEEACEYIDKQRNCVFFPMDYREKLNNFYNSLKAVEQNSKPERHKGKKNSEEVDTSKGN